MKTIEFEKEFAIELLETNLAVIKNEIQKKWNQLSAEEMIEKTRKGELEEAQGDAISLTNLVEKQIFSGKNKLESYYEKTKPIQLRKNIC